MLLCQFSALGVAQETVGAFVVLEMPVEGVEGGEISDCVRRLVVTHFESKLYNLIQHTTYQSQTMSHPNEAEQILFIGEGKVVAVNTQLQQAALHRTVMVSNKAVYTYRTLPSSPSQSKMVALSRAKNPISLELILNHESSQALQKEFRASLLLYRREHGIDSYLKELRLTSQDTEQCSLVLLLNSKQNHMYTYIFATEQLALSFYECLNQAIVHLTYVDYLSQPNRLLPYNPKLMEMVSEAFNGRIVINPEFFSDEGEEEEIEWVLTMLGGLQKNGENYRGLKTIRFCFMVIDQKSQEYFNRFSKAVEGVEKVELEECHIDGKSFHTIMLGPIKYTESLQKLKELNLASNSLSDDVFTYLTQMMGSCPFFHVLSLANNQITFQKETYVLSFLSSIKKYCFDLNLARNQIANHKFIQRYIIHVEVSCPLNLLDLSSNSIDAEEVSNLMRVYLWKRRTSQSFKMRLILTQFELENPVNFEFMVETYRDKNQSQKTVSVPVQLRKNDNRVMLEKREEDIEKLDKLLKTYGRAILETDFTKMKEVKQQLLSYDIEEQIIEDEVKKYHKFRKDTENSMIQKIEGVVNFSNTNPQQLNESINFMLRRKIRGNVYDYMVYLKHIRDQKIDELVDSNKIHHIFENMVARQRKYRYRYVEYQKMEQDSPLEVDHQLYASIDAQDLTQIYLAEKAREKGYRLFLSCLYLLSEDVDHHQNEVRKELILCCLDDPKLSSTKLARIASKTAPKFFTRAEMIGKVPSFLLPTINKIEFVSLYSMQSYHFNETFIESKLSSSHYNGLMSREAYPLKREREIISFIEIVNHFMNYLYHTPEMVSIEAATYVVYLVGYVMGEDELQGMLIQELFLHMMTYYNSQVHRMLRKGTMLGLLEHFTRRFEVSEDIIRRMVAYLTKVENYPIESINLHYYPLQPGSNVSKVDYQIENPQIVRELVINRGVIKIEIAHSSVSNLGFSVEVDELATIREIYERICSNQQAVQDMIQIEPENLQYYFLSRRQKYTAESYLYQPLDSFEHIGRVIHKTKSQSKLYLKRFLYSAQYYNLDFIIGLKEQQLFRLYGDIMSNYLQCAGLILLGGQYHEKLMDTLAVLIKIEIMRAELAMVNDKFIHHAQQEQFLELSAQQQEQYGVHKKQLITDILTSISEKYEPFMSNIKKEEFPAFMKTKIIDQQTLEVNRALQHELKEEIIYFIGLIGEIGFSTLLCSENHKFFSVINNHYCIFIEIVDNKAIIEKVQFKYLIHFQLLEEQGEVSLKFQYVKEITPEEEFNLRTIVIGGEGHWLSQCYSMIKSIAKIRLQYPNVLLYGNEDTANCLSNIKISQYEKEKWLEGAFWAEEFVTFKNEQAKRKKESPVRDTIYVNNELKSKESMQDVDIKSESADKDEKNDEVFNALASLMNRKTFLEKEFEDEFKEMKQNRSSYIERYSKKSQPKSDHISEYKSTIVPKRQSSNKSTLKEVEHQAETNPLKEGKDQPEKQEEREGVRVREEEGEGQKVEQKQQQEAHTSIVDINIDDIIKSQSSGGNRNSQEEVVGSRRSSKKELPKRRSRNR